VEKRFSQCSKAISTFSLVSAESRLADELADGALARNEANDGTGRFALPLSTSLASLGPSRVSHAASAAPACEPENQLIEKQDDAVISQRLGVLADESEAGIQIDGVDRNGARLA